MPQVVTFNCDLCRQPDDDLGSRMLRHSATGDVLGGGGGAATLIGALRIAVTPGGVVRVVWCLSGFGGLLGRSVGRLLRGPFPSRGSRVEA